MNYAPVALFVYNRPWHTRQAVASLQANPIAGETDLYIFSDAAKHTAAAVDVQEVRDYIRQVSDFKSVTIVEREQNWGLAKSIIDGVTRLCEQFGRVIVLEDDLVVAPGFLTYMNHGLERYADDDRVMQVAGYMFPIELDKSEDALFLPFTSSWGWGTWKRAWECFDASAAAFAKLGSDKRMQQAFDLEGRYPYFKMLCAQQKGQVNSWAIRWYLSVFMMNGLVLYPRKSFVKNDGFDGSGVNCAARVLKEGSFDNDFEVAKFPSAISVTSQYHLVLKSIPKPTFSIKSVFNRILAKIRLRQ